MRFFLRINWSKKTNKSRRPEHLTFRSPLERTARMQEARLEDPDVELRTEEAIDLHDRGVKDPWYEGLGALTEQDDCE